MDAWLASREAEADRQYWLTSLAGFVGAGYQAETLEKGMLKFEVPGAVTEKLLLFQSENRISSFVLAMGSVFAYYQVLRTRLGARSHDMVWEISVNGCYFGEDLVDASGMFVETLPLRLTYDEGQTFAALLQSCKAVMKAGLSHAKTSGNAYFPELQKQGVDLRALTSFSLVDNGCTEVLAKGAAGLETDVPFHLRVNHNLDNQQGLQSIDFEFNSDIFKEADVTQIWEGMLHVLE